MNCVLICRHGESPDAGVPVIRRLDELAELLSQ
jgi:hypothetical protein